MNTAQRIIAKFGGQTALAEVLARPQSTIQYWAKVGSIPAKWHKPILNAALARGLSVAAADLAAVEIDAPTPATIPEAIGDDDRQSRYHAARRRAQKRLCGLPPRQTSRM
jgi:hypothetical protein